MAAPAIRGLPPLGALDQHNLESAVERAFIASARQRVLLTDHTKFGLDHFAHVGDLSEVDVLVTDSGLPDSTGAEIEATGPQVVRA